MAVGRKESVDPQFVMNLGGALTGHGVHGAVALKVGLSVDQGAAFNRGAHGVDEGVEVANEFVVLKHGQAVAQHPVGQGLHERGLVGVKTGDQGGLGQLTQVGDEFAVFGGLAVPISSRPMLIWPPRARAFRLKARTSSSMPNPGSVQARWRG